MSCTSVYLGFDFGFKRIGLAVGQTITLTARPLQTIPARQGIPDWIPIQKAIRTWQPKALIVGLPTCVDGSPQYTTEAAKTFAQALGERFGLPVHLVDERYSTVEAKSRLFEQGGYRRIAASPVDEIAACIILEQWMQDPQRREP